MLHPAPTVRSDCRHARALAHLASRRWRPPAPVFALDHIGKADKRPSPVDDVLRSSSPHVCRGIFDLAPVNGGFEAFAVEAGEKVAVNRPRAG